MNELPVESGHEFTYVYIMKVSYVHVLSDFGQDRILWYPSKLIGFVKYSGKIK